MLGKRGARMEIETLKRSYLKRNIIIGVVVIAIISAVILTFTRAKYRVTESIPLVNGTINYSLADLNIIGLYIDGEEATELDSSKNYTLDTSKSTCTYKDGSEIENLNISYESDTKELNITPFTTKGTKCNLYFDEQVFVKDTLLANYPTQLTRNDFSVSVTDTTTGTIYKSLDESQYDNNGEVYYFAGNPTDNWVKFGGFYWRIIRINGDGTIRIIYQGTSANTTGEGTQIGTSTFNSTRTDNMYVGYMYEGNQVHGLTSDSTIKGVLDQWYQNNLQSYANNIDGNAGFCGDRSPYIISGSLGNYTYTSGGGTGTTATYYGAYTRLYWANAAEPNPTLDCANDSDLYTTSGSKDGNGALTYPVGLISADEISYAGGENFTNNTSYYLYTNQTYWSISPYHYNSSNASVLVVETGGLIFHDWSVDNTYGVRPVINLKADVQISSGTGTSTDPYVIS